MSDKKQRIDSDVADMVKFMKKYILMKDKKRLDFSATIRYVFQKHMKDNNIINKTNITERDVIIDAGILKMERIDNNFSPLLRDKLNALSYFLYKEKVTKKKLNMHELVDNLFTHYIEDYPEFKKMLLEDKYIFQRIKMEELYKKKTY